MLIDIRIIKQFGFMFCGYCACVLIAEYTEHQSHLSSIDKHYPVLKEFMDWGNANNRTEINQTLLNDYYTYLFGKYTYSYANLMCSYLKSFFKFLMENGYCGFVSFSSKPHKPKTEEEKKIEENFPKLKRVTDYYAFLGIESTSDINEIKHAYRAKALIYHPDQNQEDPNATKRFVALNTIFSVLRDETTRRDYNIVMGFEKGYSDNTKRTYTVWI